MIELKNIGVQFSGRDILKDISITFNPGEIIGLVAPNGTGKSTLMNVIMNYINPNRGKVVLNQKLEYTNKKNEVKKVVEDYISNLPVESLLDADIWSIAGEFITNPYDNSFLFVIKNILKYEFVLKENTAAIQRQLSRGMRKAIDKILPQAQKQDCPTSTLDSINVLKEVLNENVLQESYAWLGKLKIAEYQRNNKPQEVFNFISFAQTINMYKKDYGYLKDVYEYLAEHIHNPKMLKVCLDNVTRLQNSENKTSLSLNYYGIISRLNKKLGNEDVAKTAKEKYEELEKINKAKVQKFYESLMKK